MLLQIFRSCKNAVEILIEEITDTAVHLKRKKQSKPTTQTQSELQNSDESELPDVKFD